MLQPQSRRQRPTPWRAAPGRPLAVRARRRAAPPRSAGGARGRRRGWSPRCRAAAASTCVAKASVRSENFLWCPHSSPSEAQSTRRCPAAFERSAAATRGVEEGRRRGSLLAEGDGARHRPVEHADGDASAPSRRGAARSRRGPCRRCRDRPPPSRRRPRRARPSICSGARIGVAGRRARSASPASPARRPSPAATARRPGGRSAARSRRAPTGAACADRPGRRAARSGARRPGPSRRPRPSAPALLLVGRAQARHDRGIGARDPARQRGPDVERQPLVVVDDRLRCGRRPSWMRAKALAR